MIRKIRSLIVLVIGLFLMTSGVLLAQNTERHDPTAGVMMERFGNQTWMGVSVSDVTADNARELKLSSDYGAVVNEVKPDSPAAKSGVQKNDVIVEFDGERVRSVAELRRLVRETPPSRTVKIKLIRDGHPRTLSVALESSHGMTENMHLPDVTIPEIRIPAFNLNFSRRGRLGISAQELTPQLAEYFGVKQGKGVLVLEVKGGSPGEKAGLKAGDCIIKIDDKEVDSVWALQNSLNGRSSEKSGEKETHVLTVVRNHHEETATVQLEPRRPSSSHDSADGSATGIEPEPPQIAVPDLDTLKKAEVQKLKRQINEQLRQVEMAKKEALRQAQELKNRFMEMEKHQEFQQQYQNLLEQLAADHGTV